ncbi:Hypothetical Protein OBI_RACECAR_287 [Arthrobacter phage Racecar]|nr:hypothetical protein PBI_RACECAR_79 [Arthrobacter phage Racecar]
MPFIHKPKRPKRTHKCRTPMKAFLRLGTVWKCGRCGTQWVLRDAGMEHMGKYWSNDDYWLKIVRQDRMIK